jgi:pimeloyl-ACP methyl ester carboxylesterase
VVTYDQRGHGASAAASDNSLDAFLADLQAVLDALALEDPLLVGHSFGGLLAVEHAAAHSGCAGVVGVGGGLKIERPPIGWDDVQAQLDRPVSRLLSRMVTTIGMGARLSFAELQRVADEAAEREEHLEEAYARLTCGLWSPGKSGMDTVSVLGGCSHGSHGVRMRSKVGAEQLTRVPSLVHRSDGVFWAARTAPVGPTHAVCATTGAAVCGIKADRLEVLDQDWEAACFVEKCRGCFAAVAARS